jgi:protein required for attachment to host cells
LHSHKRAIFTLTIYWSIPVNTYILIADAARARIFESNALEELKLVKGFDNPRGRMRAQDLVSDEPGRMDKGRGRNVMSAMDPRTTPHEAEVHKFVQLLSGELETALRDRQAGAIALIAPAHFLGLLKQQLSTAATRAAVVERAADYTSCSERQLREHLKDVLELCAR